MNRKELDQILKAHKLWEDGDFENGKRANLSGANLSGANLWAANLWAADLYGANLSGADLRRANLYGANLWEADLREANLSGANLSGADLRRANLSGANLWEADLREANLYGANLSGADLREANLYGADLNGANLENTILPSYKIYPEEGAFIAWKKLREGYLAKIEVPVEAKRISCLISRQGRSNKIKIIEIYDRKGDVYKSSDPIKCWNTGFATEYKVGETYETELDEDIGICCSKGFHFFLTKEEAFNF